MAGQDSIEQKTENREWGSSAVPRRGVGLGVNLRGAEISRSLHPLKSYYTLETCSQQVSTQETDNSEGNRKSIFFGFVKPMPFHCGKPMVS